jgi:hypothetical protein
MLADGALTRPDLARVGQKDLRAGEIDALAHHAVTCRLYWGSVMPQREGDVNLRAVAPDTLLPVSTSAQIRPINDQAANATPSPSQPPRPC